VLICDENVMVKITASIEKYNGIPWLSCKLTCLWQLKTCSIN